MDYWAITLCSGNDIWDGGAVDQELAKFWVDWGAKLEDYIPDFLNMKACAVLESKFHQLSSGWCKRRTESQDVTQVFGATEAITCGSFAEFASRF